MKDKYIGKVIKVIDDYTVVINLGSENSTIKDGDKFLIVGLGDVISDPDTGEELEQLEIIRGKANVIHIQSKISTIESFEYEKSHDVKEIKKVISRPNKALGSIGYYFNQEQDSVTETIKPGKEILKILQDVKVGDFIMKTQ